MTWPWRWRRKGCRHGRGGGLGSGDTRPLGGHLIAGSGNSHIATLVERHSRFVMLVKIDGRDTQTVVAALIAQVKRLPAELRKSLTWHRGAELAQHKQITIATDLQIYFCDPQSPWQRGSNENTNRCKNWMTPSRNGYLQFHLLAYAHCSCGGRRFNATR